jgi:RNA polymerase sigma factor (sigma-70 family)
MPPTGAVDGSLTSEGEELGVLLPQALGALSSREQEVVRRRYGLSGLPEHTLAQIGRRLGISRERARQILRRAERKIKHTLSVLTRGDE